MTEGNRLLIGALALVVFVGVAAAFVLEWTGRSGAAPFVAIATTALGVLCPSPLAVAAQSAPERHAQGGSVEAGGSGEAGSR